MRTLLSCIAAFLTIGFTASARADDFELEKVPLDTTQRTLTVRVSPKRVPDKGDPVSACVIEFVALVPDPDLAGERATLAGAWRVEFAEPNRLNHSLTLALVANRPAGDLRLAPAQAYVRGSKAAAPTGQTIAGSNATPSVAQFIGRFDQDGVQTVRSIVGDRSFVLGYRARAGGELVEVPIDASVIRVVENETPLQVFRGNLVSTIYAGCTRQLADRLLAAAKAASAAGP